MKWNQGLEATWQLFIKTSTPLSYRIQTYDLHLDMESFKNLLDLSDYPKTHKLYEPTNKKVPLTMKDELNGKVALECTCLRFKLYKSSLKPVWNRAPKASKKLSKNSPSRSLNSNSCGRKQHSKICGSDSVSAASNYGDSNKKNWFEWIRWQTFSIGRWKSMPS